MTGAQQVAQFFIAAEGPYRLYALGFILILITGVVTQFIFHTLKWFMLILALAFIIFYLWSHLYGNFNSTWMFNLGDFQQYIKNGEFAH